MTIQKKITRKKKIPNSDTGATYFTFYADGPNDEIWWFKPPALEQEKLDKFGNTICSVKAQMSNDPKGRFVVDNISQAYFIRAVLDSLLKNSDSINKKNRVMIVRLPDGK